MASIMIVHKTLHQFVFPSSNNVMTLILLQPGQWNSFAPFLKIHAIIWRDLRPALCRPECIEQSCKASSEMKFLMTLVPFKHSFEIDSNWVRILYICKDPHHIWRLVPEFLPINFLRSKSSDFTLICNWISFSRPGTYSKGMDCWTFRLASRKDPLTSLGITLYFGSPSSLGT